MEGGGWDEVRLVVGGIRELGTEGLGFAGVSFMGGVCLLRRGLGGQ